VPFRAELAALKSVPLFYLVRRASARVLSIQPDGHGGSRRRCWPCDLSFVEFFQDGHRDDDVVFLQVEQRVGIRG